MSTTKRNVSNVSNVSNISDIVKILKKNKLSENNWYKTSDDETIIFVFAQLLADKWDENPLDSVTLYQIWIACFIHMIKSKKETLAIHLLNIPHTCKRYCCCSNFIAGSFFHICRNLTIDDVDYFDEILTKCGKNLTENNMLDGWESARYNNNGHYVFLHVYDKYDIKILLL